MMRGVMVGVRKEVKQKEIEKCKYGLIEKRINIGREEL